MLHDKTIATLKSFDDLPNAAFVSLPIVCAIFGCSPATVWRRVKTKQIPAPVRLGARTTRWNVADIRSALLPLASGQEVL